MSEDGARKAETALTSYQVFFKEKFAELKAAGSHQAALADTGTVQRAVAAERELAHLHQAARSLLQAVVRGQSADPITLARLAFIISAFWR